MSATKFNRGDIIFVTIYGNNWLIELNIIGEIDISVNKDIYIDNNHVYIDCNVNYIYINDTNWGNLKDCSLIRLATNEEINLFKTLAADKNYILIKTHVINYEIY